MATGHVKQDTQVKEPCGHVGSTRTEIRRSVDQQEESFSSRTAGETSKGSQGARPKEASRSLLKVRTETVVQTTFSVSPARTEDRKNLTIDP